MEAPDQTAVVTVKFEAWVFFNPRNQEAGSHDGLPCELESIIHAKQFNLLSADVERSKTDFNFRMHTVVAKMLLETQSELKALRPSWSCNNCQGHFYTFMSVPQAGKELVQDGCGAHFIPWCGQELCELKLAQDYEKRRALAAREPGLGWLNPDRLFRRCGFCKHDEGSSQSQSLMQCKRCRVTYYCSKECQRKHWREGGHKEACQAFSSG